MSLRMVRLASYPERDVVDLDQGVAGRPGFTLGIARVLFCRRAAGDSGSVAVIVAWQNGRAGETRITPCHATWRGVNAAGSRAEERRALALDDAADGAPQARGRAGLRGHRPPRVAEALRPCHARRGNRAACCRQVERLREDAPHRGRQAFAARRLTARRRARVNAGAEQRLAGVDVAGADDDVTASSACFGNRRPRNARCRCSPVNAGSKARVVPPSSVAAGGTSSALDHTTAPKRRGSVRRSMPRSVIRSKWSWAPGGAAPSPRPASRHAQVQQQAAGVHGSHRYLPRRVAVRHGDRACEAGCSRSQRNGLPAAAHPHASLPRCARQSCGASSPDLRKFGHVRNYRERRGSQCFSTRH